MPSRAGLFCRVRLQSVCNGRRRTGQRVIAVGATIVVSEDSVLNGRLALFDVDDTEGLAARALSDQLRTMGARLSEHEHEAALAFLVAALCPTRAGVTRA